MLKPLKEGNLIHLNRAKKARQATAKRSWRPSKSLLELAKNDIVRGRRLRRPLPVLQGLPISGDCQ
jgi:hypothetical protein